MEMLFRKSELRCNDLQRRSSLDETSTWVYDEDDGMKGVGGWAEKCDCLFLSGAKV